ncbi:D-serine ammonia-lyase [Vogesella alkaliphila]|uniref:Probable D-serine dehydratase n=1 Tax=Vogesella alkaliphila TaxID=1193621 RepID=A0ABQ2YLD0_9NEIS|nr:D-serine ammonia-lyase [Vogesella alkaliphila]GGX86113.1 putative D-serine dehydratase [Vogesella alkaliphila]
MSHLDTLPAALRLAQPLLWHNPSLLPAADALAACAYGRSDIEAAIARWQRFAPLLARLFPDSVAADGRIDSPLLSQPDACGQPLWVKADHALPITACIKARGGVYEVLCHAEELAQAAGLLPAGSSYTVLAEAPARELFAQHRILVGSTGNLGYSVGVMARALGLQVEVHMSHDAKEWKKQRLRALGAGVVEHQGDYALAVAAARDIAAADPHAYFIDDESSLLLFFGYAAAAWDLAPQLAAAGLRPTPEQPLRVYLPCGVGGAPGGVAFGLKCLFGDAVQCVLVEPVASPCFLLRLASGDDTLSVYDIGLDNQTVADGLAVPRASATVAGIVSPLIDAVITVSDASLLAEVRRQWQQHGLRLEPSAAAGFVAHLLASEQWPGDIIPVVWTTGGNGLPDEVFFPLLAE